MIRSEDFRFPRKVFFEIIVIKSQKSQKIARIQNIDIFRNLRFSKHIEPFDSDSILAKKPLEFA